MPEYIDREAAISAIEWDAWPGEIERIKAIPAADVATVRHGKWKFLGIGHYECTNCKKINDYPYNYCPNCGAKMEEEV